MPRLFPCVKAMSKIFEALRRAELLRAKRKEAKTVGACGYTDRRLTSRTYVRIRLFIYGYMPGGDPFYEETYSIVVNGAGGLISMTSDVRPGQRLVVTNEGNEQSQECVVVSVEPYRSHIALKFPAPTPQFWRDLEIGKSAARLPT
jgi:hypothetical protein